MKKILLFCILIIVSCSKNIDNTSITENSHLSTATTPPNVENNNIQNEFAPCNGITLTSLPGTPSVKDTFNNTIKALGQYGTEKRQQYAVYLPENKNVNSPVIVLIHGGGWAGGPNPDFIKGWPFGFTKNKSDNFVKNLLDKGYVVVNLLYRLTRYGNTNSEITSNPVPLQEQIKDINNGILHIKNNFPNCLSLNANSIQVLGESAGGHLALTWAYTHADKSYIKSVTTMYCPTNLQQYGQYLKNKPCPFVCGQSFNNNLLCKHFPWYFPIEDINNPNLVFNLTNFDCSAKGFPNSKVIDSYKLVQSLVKTVISSPSASTELANASPSKLLNQSLIIPTFIMHGKNDQLVPHTYATTNMNTSLSIFGGLVFNFGNSLGNVPTSYTSSSKHGIKYYDAANHGWTSIIPENQDNLYKLVKSDAIKWLDGHK